MDGYMRDDFQSAALYTAHHLAGECVGPNVEKSARSKACKGFPADRWPSELGPPGTEPLFPMYDIIDTRYRDEVELARGTQKPGQVARVVAAAVPGSIDPISAPM
jgi:hypothetical protein